MSLGQGAGTPRLRRGGAALLAFASLGALAASASAAPPTITDLTATQISTTEATLSANVNPNGKATLYHFEYGPQDCSLNPNPCTAVPVPDGRLEGATQALPVSYHLTGLTPLGTYHFRLIAKSGGNEGGETPSPDQTFNTFAPPPGFDPCANESFRALQHAALPDCRAYEQVSPTDKNGNEATGDIDFIQTSPAGDAFTYAAFSGVPGAAGSQNWGTYIAHREPGAWLTTGLLPPTKYGYTALVDGLTTDLAYSFSNPSLGGSTPTTFVAQGTFDGSDTAVAPAAGAVIDGGAGDSLVYFKSTALLAPGGLAGQQNIYLWDRPSGAITFAAHGTEAPIGYVRASHPVSANGQKLYFKDAGQIYLRAGAAGPAPSTAHVSASQRTDCAGDPTCGGDGQPDPEPDPLGSAPASFRFAATDGSRALFTSSEELTDDANTTPDIALPEFGRANVEDGLGAQALPVSLATNPPNDVAIDASHIYWTEPGQDAIGRADLDGENADPDFITGLENPQFLAVDPAKARIYWTNAGDGANANGSIGRADLPGGDNLTNSFITGLDNPQGIAVDATRVWWANAGVGEGHARFAYASATDGSGVTAFGNEREGPLDWAAPGTDVAVDDENFYFDISKVSQSRHFGAVYFVPVSHLMRRPQILHEDKGEGRGLATDGTHVYWGNDAGIGRSEIPTVSNGCGTAVDSHGDLFLGDSGSIDVYDPAGNLILTTDTSTEENCAIAVDSQGNVYTVARGELVMKLIPSNPGAAPTAATTYTPDPTLNDGAIVPGGGNGVFVTGVNRGVAVDPSNDNVYVGHTEETPKSELDSHIRQYRPDGTLVTATIGDGVPSDHNWYSVGVYGANHNVYTTDGHHAYIFSAANLAGPPIMKMDWTGEPIEVDQSNGHFYLFFVAKTEEAGGKVSEYDASGTPVSQSSKLIPFGTDVAIDNSGGANDGTIYVASSPSLDAFSHNFTYLPSLSHNPHPDPDFVPGVKAVVGVAADGSHLYWGTNPPHPTANPGNDLYSYQASSGELTDLTPDPGEEDGAEVIGFLGASEDAESVYFVANGVLAAGATAGNCEKVPTGYSGACNLYLSRAGAITFIARLDTSATEKFTSGIEAEANWLTKSGQAEYAGFSRLARVSADGDFLLFYSSAQLSAAENHGAYEFYRYSAQTKQIDCLSCPPNGAPPSASVTIDALRFPSPFAPSQPNEVLVRNFSADGTRAFFETGQKMVVTDTDGDLGCPTLQGYNGHFLPRCLDVYEWEAPGAGSCTEASSAYSALNGGCVYLLSAGAGTDPSFFADASASGDRAFIFTREALVPNDGDQQQDIYAASALGGLASQHTAATDPPPCQGDACRGPYSSPPDLPGAASTVFEGLPDPTPKRPRHCPKGTRRVRRAGKTSCVKGHHKRAGKRAGHDHRRGSR